MDFHTSLPTLYNVRVMILHRYFIVFQGSEGPHLIKIRTAERETGAPRWGKQEGSLGVRGLNKSWDLWKLEI